MNGNYSFISENLSRLKNQLEFLVEIDKMKTVFRQSLIVDKSREENDAEHSWHIAVMAVTLYEYAYSSEVDINRVVKMLLIHDLVEIYAGDTFAYDTVGNLDKEKRETEAANKLFALLPSDQGEEYYRLWVEFDAMETPDSIYASAIDRFQPFILNYETDGHTWVKHGTNSEQVYKRMAIVKTAMPEVWHFMESAVNDSIERGILKK